MFRLKCHNDILSVLQRLDSALLTQAACFFGGETAIVMQLGEYRESVDIDFMCASQSGYRLLRQAVWGRGLKGLLAEGAGIEELREMRSDQYGIRTILHFNETRIKFEIVREARIELHGAVDRRFGIPLLARVDMYAEKLLANADRWADRAVLSRDIIDLSMMISRWGPIPPAAWEKAKAAYGDTVEDAYRKAVAALKLDEWLEVCMEKMCMAPELEAEILAVHA